MKICAIAAMGLNRAIGVNNKLPWHVPEDFQFFKEKTKGKILILGRRTFESIGSKPLPHRQHIVITRQTEYRVDNPDVHVVGSLAEALGFAQMIYRPEQGEIFIAGGSEIYRQSLNSIERLYLSVIQQEFAGDSFFPELEGTGLKLSSQELRKGAIPFVVEIYDRVQ